MRPAVAKRIKAGTTISQFLQDSKIEWSNRVRVNGGSVARTYKLKASDFITLIAPVSGGLN